MNNNDVKQLKQLLARMQEADPDYRVFGTDYHKYRFGPTLSEEQLQAFEQQHQIRLPEDYRFFLKEVGDGGAVRSTARVMAINAGPGPGFGVHPLEAAVIGCDLSKPFPLTRSSSEQSVDGIDEWGGNVPFPGLLEICYHGSSFMSFLVVNGPSYGTVWDLDYQYDPTGLSFEQWYQRWIDWLVDKVLPKLVSEHMVK